MILDTRMPPAATLLFKSHRRSSFLQRLLLLSFPRSRWLQALLSCGCITPVSATPLPALLLCVFSSSVSYNILSTEFRTHLNSAKQWLANYVAPEPWFANHWCRK